MNPTPGIMIPMTMKIESKSSLLSIIKLFFEANDTQTNEEKSLTVYPFKNNEAYDLNLTVSNQSKFLYSFAANYVFGFKISNKAVAKKLSLHLRPDFTYLNLKFHDYVKNSSLSSFEDLKILNHFIYTNDIKTKLTFYGDNNLSYSETRSISSSSPITLYPEQINEILLLDCISSV